MVDSRYRTAGLVMLLALASRLAGVVVTTLTGLNSYAQGDANGFASAASLMAAGIRQGVFTLSVGYSETYQTWAIFLTPFWLLPGPSRLYARVGMALLGVMVVYNVYVIARSHASQRAALLAVAPLVCYPSFVFVQSTVLREVAILAGITTAARLLIVPPRRLSTVGTYALTAVSLGISTLLRSENLPLFVCLLVLAALLKYRAWIWRSSIKYPVLASVSGLAIVAVPMVRQSLARLANIRRSRARGRTVYLDWIFPETIGSAIAFSWIGATYFLFTPFPWMVEHVADIVVALEAAGNLVFALFGILGARILTRRNLTVGVTLTVGVVLGAVLYGLGTANVGTAVRHRQMLLWAVFILGGIGFATRFEVLSDVGRLLDETPSKDGKRDSTAADNRPITRDFE